MGILQNTLAIIRGILLILMMAFYLLGYAVTRIFWKHTRSSGLRLRKAYMGQMAYPILNIKVQVEGKPCDGPALYVCNHRSFSDPIVISKYLSAFVIAKAEVAKYPIINKGAEATGIIWVQRTDKDSRTNARKAFVDVVKGGHNILVYPEGTISTTKNTLPFKKGTFLEAAKEGLTIVPVALEYRSKKDLWLIPNILSQYLNAFGKWKTETKLTFGPPLKMEDGIKLSDECEQWINA
ncbi:MAG: 1-acyl-sn-glycerol-3-phosphate acyltransferase, partial [Saprospiraceae bacterium]